MTDPGGVDAVVREAFADQARRCERLGSPFTARLMRALARTLDRSTRTGRGVLDWSGRADANGDAVPLRLAGALNALSGSGAEPSLTRVWPPSDKASEAGTLDAILAATLARHDDTLLDWLDRAPQTNEVGRSAAVYAALMHVAGRHPLPMALFELGASAGLNLLPDRYGHTLGGRRCGALDSPVQLAPAWTGPAPGGIEPRVIARRGCDRSPVPVADPMARARLLAYVWPDQVERVERTRAALDIAAADPPDVDRADAADWVESVLAPTGASGTTRVLFHTIARQYFPAEVASRVAARIEACGAAATVDAPFAHIAFEQDDERGPTARGPTARGPTDRGPILDVTVWPGGATRRLAHAQAHGSAVDWHGD